MPIGRFTRPTRPRSRALLVVLTTSIAALTFAIAIGAWPHLSGAAWRWLIVPSAATLLAAVVGSLRGNDRTAGCFFIAMAIVTPTGFAVVLNLLLVVAAVALIATTRGVVLSDRGAARLIG